MAVNLTKNQNSLKAAWKDVLDEKTDTNWALFGYEGQTNDLKVIGTGNGGIEEMTEDLNSGKIMYAFIKVNDPKTSLDKCVLINWQGEGANTVRKGICANHLRDIEKFFIGAHMTINARNEEEVEPQLIIDKVAKAGSAYSFKAPKSSMPENNVPVGSAYKRVNPIKEINSLERDQFWKKEGEEEKRRVEEEERRKLELKKKAEVEFKKRDEEAAAKREQETLIRNNNIDEIKNAQKVEIPKTSPSEDTAPITINRNIVKEQRQKEAEELISQRNFDARSMFENNLKQEKKAPEKPVRNSILKAQEKAIKKEELSDEEDQFSTIKRSPKDLEKKNSESTPTTPLEPNPQIEKEELENDIDFINECIYGLTSDLKARALYDYQAADDTEISFDPGDIITNIDQVDEGWWQGLGPDGITYGLFPANYVELI